MRVAIVDPPSAYKSLFDYLGRENMLTEVIDYQGALGPESCDIVLSSSAEWNSRSATMIARAKRAGLPTLHIVDGVVKWGTAWPHLGEDGVKHLEENACLPAYQPVLCHKIACLGPAQARLLASWGQQPKVEVTGNPRMDPYVFHQRSRRAPLERPSPGGPVRLLIIVANRPGYTTAELDKARQSLEDLNTFLKRQFQGDQATIVWRIGPRSPEVMPAEVVGRIDRSGCSLLEALQQADAVISSPSTATLEAMSMEIPTCVLDYVSSPELLQAAWTIRSKDAMGPELRSLFGLDERRMQFQRYLIHDQMRIDAPASPRVGQLMRDMVALAEQCRAGGREPTFPAEMVSGFEYSDQLPYHYAPDQLFPAHPIFSRPDSSQLQRELANLQHYCALLERNLDQLTQDFSLGLVVKSKLKVALHRFLHFRGSPR
jgi:hypothetical protein